MGVLCALQTSLRLQSGAPSQWKLLYFTELGSQRASARLQQGCLTSQELKFKGNENSYPAQKYGLCGPLSGSNEGVSHAIGVSPTSHSRHQPAVLICYFVLMIQA